MSNPSPMQTGCPADAADPALPTLVCEARTAEEVVMVVGMKLVNVVDEDVTVEGIDVTIVVITNEEEAESPVLVAEEERDAPEDVPVVAAPEVESGIGELVVVEVGECESELEPVSECEDDEKREEEVSV